MGYSISAYTFGENVSAKMDFDCPFTDGKFVGDEEFIDICERYGSTIYLHDSYQPSWYVRPYVEGDIIRLEREVKEKIPENVEHFLGFLDWLRRNPKHWLEGSH